MTNLLDTFTGVKLEHMPHGDNIRVDVLSKLASTKKNGGECMIVDMGEETWMEPCIPYLRIEDILEDEDKNWAIVSLYENVSSWNKLSTYVRRMKGFNYDDLNPSSWVLLADYMGKGHIKFLLVDIDYFNKWIKSPHNITTNNGCQFTDKEVTKFYTRLGIKHITSLVEHSYYNEQVEVVNKVILVELKKPLNSTKGLCATCRGLRATGQRLSVSPVENCVASTSSMCLLPKLMGRVANEVKVEEVCRVGVSLQGVDDFRLEEVVIGIDDFKYNEYEQKS
ncbi:hypothetical protein V8G54_034830 [Vigna mungo]|uniref:Integrase catalytic domain-containing protein n=1 Tax=Vigna mungo TaxID=3915 RepID=A0AAQ3MDV0_VIGMU